MDMIEARRKAKEYRDDGIPAIADNLGGWSGQAMSQVWGIRLVSGDWIAGGPEDWVSKQGMGARAS